MPCIKLRGSYDKSQCKSTTGNAESELDGLSASLIWGKNLIKHKSAGCFKQTLLY